MPSEESMKKAAEICAPSYCGGRYIDDAQHILDVATALDEAKAERTEEIAAKLIASAEGYEALRVAARKDDDRAGALAHSCTAAVLRQEAVEILTQKDTRPNAE